MTAVHGVEGGLRACYRRQAELVVTVRERSLLLLFLAALLAFPFLRLVLCELFPEGVKDLFLLNVLDFLGDLNIVHVCVRLQDVRQLYEALIPMETEDRQL